MFLDVTNVKTPEEMVSDEFCDSLSKWLITEQPITLSINGDEPSAGYPMTSKLFERTSNSWIISTRLQSGYEYDDSYLF